MDKNLIFKNHWSNYDILLEGLMKCKYKSIYRNPCKIKCFILLRSQVVQLIWKNYLPVLQASSSGCIGKWWNFALWIWMLMIGKQRPHIILQGSIQFP